MSVGLSRPHSACSSSSWNLNWHTGDAQYVFVKFNYISRSLTLDNEKDIFEGTHWHLQTERMEPKSTTVILKFEIKKRMLGNSILIKNELLNLFTVIVFTSSWLHFDKGKRFFVCLFLFGSTQPWSHWAP